MNANLHLPTAPLLSRQTPGYSSANSITVSNDEIGEVLGKL